MKAHPPEMQEGPAAFERFRKAVKAVIAVPKEAVPAATSKARTKKKKAAQPKA